VILYSLGDIEMVILRWWWWWRWW